MTIQDYIDLSSHILNTGDVIAADLLLSAGLKTFLIAAVTEVENETFG